LPTEKYSMFQSRHFMAIYLSGYVGLYLDKFIWE